MTKTGLIPDDLLQNIQKGDSILFFGADKPLPYSDAPLSHPQLAQNLARKYGLPLGKNWAETAQNYLNQNPTDRHGLLSFLRAHNSGPQVKPGPIHQAIAAAGFRAIVSAWYDDVLEETLQKAGYRVNQVVRDRQIPFATQGEREVIVVKLYGSLRDPDSLKCSTWDEDDLMGQLNRKLELVNYFWTIRPPLFVGFDLLQEMPRRLYVNASANMEDLMRRTYAIWPDDLTELRAYWQQKNVQFHQSEATTFLQSLATQLSTATSGRAPTRYRVTRAPYKFLDYYDTQDADIFCGRETERQIVTRLALTPPRLLTLFGPSGAGKTSLLLAGVVPNLQAEAYQHVYVRALDDPLPALRKAVAARAGKTDWQVGNDLSAFLQVMLDESDRLLIIMDQFEELFLRVGSRVRQQFFAEVAAVIETPTREVRFLLSLREDYLPHLDEARSVLPDILGHSYRLHPLDRGDARVAITEPAARASVTVAIALVDALVGTEGRDGGVGGDLVEEKGQVPPAVLQIVLHRLYQDALPQGSPADGPPPPGVTLTLDAYRAIQYRRVEDGREILLRGTEAILAEYVSQAIALLPQLQQADGTLLRANPVLARELLKVMVTSQATKAALTQADMAAWLEADGVIQLADEADHLQLTCTRQGLEQVRLVRSFERDGIAYYELAHDYLATEIGSWLDEAEKKTRLARELLQRALDNWHQAELLIQPEILALIQERHTALKRLTEEEVVLLFRSALAVEGSAALWFSRAQALGVDVTAIARKGLIHRNYRNRVAAVAVMIQLGEPFAYDLIPLLVDEYPQVRVAAIHALEQMWPDLGWHQHLVHECYVPAGPFVMGDDTGSDNEKPVHEVDVAAFYIGKYPVTNMAYQRYMDDIGRAWQFPQGREQHPVVNMRWYDARDYAVWAGMRLLTEAEWEKAATWKVDGNNALGLQGNSGEMVPKRTKPQGRKLRYPWGDTFDANRCNTEESGPIDTTSVRDYSSQGDSPFGVADMVGNVWEWTSTLFRNYPYDAADGREDPAGNSNRVLRGGSYINNQSSARGGYRHFYEPDHNDGNYGFRCGVRSVQKFHPNDISSSTK
ncbi:MAG: hypothetical protein CL609_07585 [Anaerolineaceae bacterium]|nr:hypothetical protein [Anaerolineaceae bacterium]